MGLFFKAQLQMWSKLSDELDGVDTHTIRKLRAVLEKERKERHKSIWNTVFILINAGGGGGGSSIRIALEIT